MSGGAIIAIIVIAVIIVGVVCAAAVYGIRQQQLRRRFGPEYDRLVAEYHSRRKAVAELTRRERRVRDLGIRELDPSARTRYWDEWAGVQELFVDTPQRTVAEAQRLVMTIMTERGYPAEQDDQILADLSVDHGSVLDHYRVAAAISERAAAGSASTEDLRQALINYRTLFQELLGGPREPMTEAPAPGAAPAPADGTVSAPPADTAPAAPEDATAAEPAETIAAEDEAQQNGVARQGARTVRE